MRRPLPFGLLLVGTTGLALLALQSTVGAATWVGVRRVVTLLAAGDLGALREYLRGFGAWAPVASATLMQLQAVVAPLPSFPLMYANGLLFGTWWGGLLSWVSILVSAVLCFGLARLFGRPLVERFVSPAALGRADGHLDRLGTFAIFLGRLIPLTSFDLLSYAAGLTSMRLGPFCLATALGMTPSIFLTAAAADVGWRSPWALVAGLLGIGALAGLAAVLRPRVVGWLGSPPARSSGTG